MAYATVADVQARFPTQILTINATSQPTTTQVTEWLAQQSLWIDQTLRWKYDAPLTDAEDLLVLKPIAAALVAAQVWGVLGSFGSDAGDVGANLRREALSMLAYDPKTGRSNLVLPDTALADTGEASLGQPLSTFTDPALLGEDGLPANPRFFTTSMEL